MRTNRIKARQFCVLALSICIAFVSCTNSVESEYSVLKGHFTQSFTESGSLAALKVVAIPVPAIDWRYGYELKIVDMIVSGSYVKEGDTIIKLDDSSIQKFIISGQEALEKEKAIRKKQEVESTNSIQELKAQLSLETASFNLKKLELEKAKYEPENKRKIKQLQFQQAEIRINKLKHKLEIKPRMNQYDRRTQEIKILQKEAQLQGAFDALAKMDITSPKDGLFQAGTSPFNYPPQDLKIGDGVMQGFLIASIPNVEYMMINTTINEADFTKIALGSIVRLRLDALPKVAFNGRITHIGRSCILQEKERIFKVRVEVDESDLRLKPGMTVSCEFICYENNNEIFAPNECVLKENGEAFVFLDKGSSPKKIRVEASFSNANHTVISGNIKAGQRLIPFEQIINQ